jgi:superfamily I DNA/RNA helicase
VYVDEFQDTTPCVLDIILNQQGHMKIVMVGDARQAIYGWRGAVNAMQMVDCASRHLTKSFRYGQAVADIATAVLEGAMTITGNEKIASVAKNAGIVDESQPYTRLFRTNSALLYAAISEIRKGTEVSIEIDVKDFVKLLQSAVALYRGDMKNVKHDKMLPYTEWYEMVAESKGDAELGRIVKVVKEGLAENWISILKCHCNSREPHVTFTTAHKSKGREWSQVRIESDFKSCYNEDGEWTGLSTEEQNLLYVASTRAIDKLEYNLTVAEYLGVWEDSEEQGTDERFGAYVKSQVALLKRDVNEDIAA